MNDFQNKQNWLHTNTTCLRSIIVMVLHDICVFWCKRPYKINPFIMPFSLYLSLIYWVYPLKDIFGETGCYIMTCLRNMGTFMIQLQSFFMATFRYICLFHDDFLIRFSLSPMVSISVNSSRIVSKEIILFWICNMQRIHFI